MRVSIAALSLSLMLISPAFADDVWFRVLTSPIPLSTDGNSGVPDGGGNSEIAITMTTSAAGRVYGDLQIDVGITGIDATYSIGVTGLAGASWVSTGIGQGHIAYPSAIAGTHTATIEIRNSGNSLVASQTVQIIVHPELTASLPQTSYEVDVGGTLVITPAVANLIADGAVQWGGNLPTWLDLNTADGTVAVDTSEARSASDLILTAVDQTDLRDASTQPFSVAVNDTCPWTAHPAAEQNSWTSVTYGNGRFVAVALNGTNRIMTSTNGTTWAARAAPGENDWRSVVYGGGRFVAVGSWGQNRIMTSTNGLSWTAIAAPEQNSWWDITHGNGQFVAVALNGTNRIMTSTNGTTWTARVAPEQNNWSSITYGGGRYVAISSEGTNRIMTSSNGTSWTVRAAPEQNSWQSVTYGGGQFVAVAADGTNRIMTSANGISWTARAAPEQNSWRSVTYGDGQFVAVAMSGNNRIMTSTDGINWTVRAAPEQIFWNEIVHGAGKFVVVASNGTNRIMTSSGCS